MTMPRLRQSSSLYKVELILWPGTLGGHRRRPWSPPPSGSTGTDTTRPHSAIGMRTRQEQPQPTRSCCESTARHPRGRRVGRAFVPFTPRMRDIPYEHEALTQGRARRPGISARIQTRSPPAPSRPTCTRAGIDTYIRADFAELTSTGLMRAAGSPAQEGQGPRRTPPPWDSPEARDQWAQEKLDQGIDPAVVRAARTGDMALSRPASEATRTATGSSEGLQQASTPRESSPGD